MIRKWIIALQMLILSSFAFVAAAAQRGNTSYLPLSVGSRWVLRNARQNKPVVFEVIQRDGNGLRVRSTTPWGMSEWTLDDHDGKFFMTGYGNGDGRMMPIPEGTLYLDFTSPAGSQWSNSLGTMKVTSRNVEVKGASRSYRDCVQIRHNYKGGASVFTFAPGVGFVQFGEGNQAFVLDEAGSGTGPATAVNASPAEPPGPTRPTRAGGRQTLIGMTPNRFATDPDTPDSLIKRFNQTLDAGVNFMVANGKWTELEPKNGQYSLGSVSYLLSSTKQMPVSYTLRIIDTVDRNVPSDLRRTRWNDPKMRSRLNRLIDEMIPLIKGRVRWFMIGYEITEYFNRHPNEVGDFVELYRDVAAHVRERAPGIKVSTTLMFNGIGQLSDRLSAIDPNLDFIALTYSPLNGDFTVQPPSAVPGDFQKMMQVAGRRPIVLQEIAYPSSPVVNSSEDQQAEFYRTAFRELDRNSSRFQAVNWMLLADLSDDTTKQFSQFYGLKGAAKFEATLQTLGVFDVNGRPKKSWSIFREQVRR